MSIFDQMSEQWAGLKDPLDEADVEAENQAPLAPTYTPGPEVPVEAGLSGTGKILLVAGGAFLIMR